MTVFIIRRLVQSIFVLLATSVLVFLGVYAIGNPVDILISPDASFAEREQAIVNLGLDRPMPGISILVVARNAAEAYVAAGGVMPIGGVRLFEAGREVMDLARRHGVADGGALVLNTTLDQVATAA